MPRVTPFSAEALAVLEARIARLNAATPPLWGTMTTAIMLAHLRHALAISLAEVPVDDHSNFFLRLVGKVLSFWRIENVTFPRNLRAPDAYAPRPADDLTAERDALLDALRRFADALAADPARVTRNPYLGPMTLRTWSRIHAPHIDHHLRQFGV